MDLFCYLCFVFVFVMLSCLFLAAVCPPASKGLTSWLSCVLCFIKFQMDKGHFVGMVLLDLQKELDTVDHSILLMKLEALGLSQDIIRWFQS